MAKIIRRTSSQDGGRCRYSLPPCTTKRWITTDLKTKNNPNSQKIELYGSLTAKELKKKHSHMDKPRGWGSVEARGGGLAGVVRQWWGENADNCN